MNGRPDIDLGNTPGIYYAVAYCIATELFLQMNSRKRAGISRWLISALMLVLLSAFMQLTKGTTGVAFILSVGVIYCFIFLHMYLIGDMDVCTAAYYSVRAYMLGEFAASFEWQLFYYGLTSMNVELTMPNNFLFLIPTHAVVFTVSYFLERRFRESNREMPVTRSGFLGAFIIVVIVFALSNISYAFTGNSPFTTHYTAEIFLIRTIVDFGGVIILYIYHMLLAEFKTRQEVNALRMALEMQYENYKASEESVALVNRKYHDLKHQIAILRDMAKEQAEGNETGSGGQNAVRYLDQMEADIKAYEAQNKTGSRVLDTILTSKSLVCQQQEIQLNAVADGAALSFIDAMDLSSLFGNALDNAIESASKVENAEERLIRLSVARQKGFLQIRCENRYEGTIRFRNGMPLTSKGDEAYHGYGVKSIRATAEKYGGTLTIDASEGWFRLRILMPVPAD